MRVLDATFSATYSGRLTTSLASARRALIIKADSTVLLIDESCGFKPRNWMVSPKHIHMPSPTSLPTTWTFTNGIEHLTVHLQAIHSDTFLPLDLTAPGLDKHGTEFDLQAHLLTHHDEIEPGLTPVRREYDTTAGPVDLAFRDEDNTLVLVEVKRKTTLSSVDQLARYVHATREATGEPVRGILAAFDVRPRTRTACDKHGFTWTEVTLPS